MNPCHWKWKTSGCIIVIENESMISTLNACHRERPRYGIVIDTLNESHMKDTPTGRVYVQIVKKKKKWQTWQMLKFPEVTEIKFQQIFLTLFPIKTMSAEVRCILTREANQKAHDVQIKKKKSRILTDSPPGRKVADQFFCSQLICQRVSFGNLTTASQTERLGVRTKIWTRQSKQLGIKDAVNDNFRGDSYWFPR